MPGINTSTTGDPVDHEKKNGRQIILRQIELSLMMQNYSTHQKTKLIMPDMNEKEIQDLKRDVSEIKSNVYRVLSYMESDPKTKRMGMFEKQLDHEERIQKIEINDKMKAKEKSLFAVIGAAIVTGLQFLYKFIFE